MSKIITLIGKSQALAELKEKIANVAKTNATVLVLGESGSGKELVASLIHQMSSRHNQNFVPINCGAIPNELLESELFGHEKGAFTGAQSQKPGKFEQANGGTLFLDEISEMPLFMQVKLLRALQEQKIERLGATSTLDIDLRVVAATNKNLEQMIADGSFREDLFYRLNVLPLYIPPLRNRKDDIPLLIEHFKERIAERDSVSCNFSDRAMQSILDYDWPGNVRELYNIVERMCVMFNQQTVETKDLPEVIKAQEINNITKSLSQEILATTSSMDNNFSLKDRLLDLEIAYIKQALADESGVVAKAARRLGLRRTTLVEKMKKLNIKAKDVKEA